MADVLKTTHWWNANPVFVFTDNSGAGYIEANIINAAQSHDGNDATRESLQVSGDTASLEGDTTGRAEKAITAGVVGGIKFVRVKMRARVTRTGGSGSVSALIRPMATGVDIGAVQSVTGSFVTYTEDVLVDPTDGQPWTAARVQGHLWGVAMRVQTSDPGVFATTGFLELSEFLVEVWGEDKVGVITGASATADANRSIETGGSVEVLLDQRDPSFVGTLATNLDDTSGLVTIRSFKASLNDQSTATKDVFTSGVGAAGTQLQPLYGTASQGVQGNTGAGNGINGTGAISGMKLCALVRVSKQAAGTVSNVRFGTAMGVKALAAPGATIRDYDQPLTEAMWETVKTDLVTTGQFGQPLTWGNDVDSIWASLFGWTFNFTYGGGGIKQLEVAEAWVEVYGPVGSEPEVIELVQVFDDKKMVVTLQPEV